MPDPVQLEQLVCLLFAGVGMVLIGGLNLLLARASGRLRAIASIVVGGAVLAGYAAWNSEPGAISRVAAVVGAALVATLVLGSRWLAAAGNALRKPCARWGLLAAGGIAAIVVGVVNYTRHDERAIDASMAELELLTTIPDLKDIEQVPAKTDRGRSVVLRLPVVVRDTSAITTPETHVLRSLGYDATVIRRSPANDHTNCHGWVFAGGQYWLAGDSVDSILTDNGYTEVTNARPGDVAIYRNPAGVTHSGVVRYVADGMPPMIESKWGWMGVFLHPVDKSAYGQNVTYYRSSRNGHTLAGLQHPAPTTTALVLPVAEEIDP